MARHISLASFGQQEGMNTIDALIARLTMPNQQIPPASPQFLQENNIPTPGSGQQFTMMDAAKGNMRSIGQAGQSFGGGVKSLAYQLAGLNRPEAIGGSDRDYIGGTPIGIPYSPPQKMPSANPWVNFKSWGQAIMNQPNRNTDKKVADAMKDAGV